MLAGAVLICTVCMVGALGYMGYNFYQFRQERTDFLEYQAKKGELEAQLQSLLADNEKCCVICLKSRHWKLNCAGH